MQFVIDIHYAHNEYNSWHSYILLTEGEMGGNPTTLNMQTLLQTSFNTTELKLIWIIDTRGSIVISV